MTEPPGIPTDVGELSDLLEAEPRATQTTPNFGLPYPQPTDPVSAGAANIQALAQAIDSSTKIVSIKTPVVTVGPNAGEMRPPAYEGEIVCLWFWGGYFNSGGSAMAFAKGLNPDNAGLHWWVLGGPVIIGAGAEADLALGAGTTNDPSAQIPLPKWMMGYLAGAFALKSGIVDAIVTDSAAHSSYWSSNGRGTPFVYIRSLHNTQLAGTVFLQYYAAAGATVGNRRLQVEIMKVIP